MNSKHVLIAFLVVLAVFGSALSYLDIRGVPEPEAMRFGSLMVFSGLTFAWFWLDSEARAYKRSPFMSVFMVAFAAAAVPYYLLRSRPKGARLKAIGNLLGFVVLSIVALEVGSLTVLWLSS